MVRVKCYYVDVRDRLDDFTIKQEQEKCVFVENCPKEISFKEPLNKLDSY